MSEILEQAIEALRAQPEEEANRIAYEILQRLEDKDEWGRLVFAGDAQIWLARAAAQVLKKYRKISSRVTSNIISLPAETLRMRGDSYWQSFDELPKEVRELAEQNFNLWKQDSKHPSLRFRKIHKELPIYSFRVGMRNRTVGVKTDDDRIIWFWVGSFDQFKQMIKEDLD